jgi:hypothetical protein
MYTERDCIKPNILLVDRDRYEKDYRINNYNDY